MNFNPQQQKLKTVAPLVFFILWGFAVTNILIGASLIHTQSKVLPYVLIHRPFTTEFWGSIFILLGIVGATSLILNYWKLTRRTVFMGLFIKSLWLYALLLRGSIAGIGVWGFLVYIQTLIAINFPEEK